MKDLKTTQKSFQAIQVFRPASLGDQCGDRFKHTLRYRNCNLKCDYDIRDIGGENEQNNNSDSDEIGVWVLGGNMEFS